MNKINLKKAIVVILLSVLGVTMFIGCGNKTEINKNDFCSKMQENGFEVSDVTDQFEKDIVKSVTIAMNDKYQIEFYEMNSEDDAVDSYNKNKSNIENYKGSVSANTSVEIGNYSKYSVMTKEKYYCVDRVGKTFIYIAVPADYKSEVSDYLEQLGY